MSKTTEKNADATHQTDVINYKLKQPKTIDGVEYESIDLAFYSLTGDDIANTEFEMISGGNIVAGPAEFNKTYLMHISARAAKLPFETFKQLSIKDISAITMMTQNFLMQ